eukprot:TRINITY_DN9864_c0_g5_i1.p1 TRINITY_DN9864_c0_g5~~TRINITY_DN9864_c0_g5_i1.p1  ORF type:complete len:663 (+),score=115.83 TRINITY_DN9864_c0_g5_i1:82-1989(+)
MGTLAEALSEVQDNLPPFLSWVEQDGERVEVYLEEGTSEALVLFLPNDYERTYPKGVVTCVIAGEAEPLGEGSILELLTLLHEKAQACTKLPQCNSQSESDGFPRGGSTMSGGSVDDLHPQILRDVDAVRKLYGDTCVSVSEKASLNQVFITLNLDVSFLSSTVCNAWDLERSSICLELRTSRTGYFDTLQASSVKVRCYQPGRDWCGPAGQLEGILTYFVESFMKQRSEDVHRGITPHSRALLDAGFAPIDVEDALQLHSFNVQDAFNHLMATRGKRERLSGEHEKKRVPPCLNGVLCQILEYSKHRLLTCPEYCVICDNHILGGNLKPTVCYRELCAFAFQTLGVGAKAAKGLSQQPGVMDLLVRLAMASARSERWNIIFTPYPTVFNPDNQNDKILHPTEKNIHTVRKLMDGFTRVDAYSAERDFQVIGSNASKWCCPLLQWILSSNTSHLMKLTAENRIKLVPTVHQYLMVSAPPSKEKRFEELKQQYGTKFAFHGSPTENWHSILRNGLYCASGTEFQVTDYGFFGKGIYLSPHSGVSLGYMRGGAVQRVPGRNREPNFLGENFHCIAICEVIDHELTVHAGGQEWLMKHEDHVVTRFLMALDEDTCTTFDIDTQKPEVHQLLKRVVDSF